MQIFGGKFADGSDSRSHFDTFSQSCLTVFQVLVSFSSYKVEQAYKQKKTILIAQTKWS